MAEKDHAKLIEQFTHERCVLEGYILAIVRDARLAEDVYQDVAVAVLQSLDRYDPDYSFSNWVRGIARNKAKTALSKVARHKPTPSERLTQLIDTAYAEQDDSTRDVLSQYHVFLRECLKRLKGSVQTMVRLRYQQNLSIKAIAGKLSKTPDMITVGLYRTRKTLFDCINKRRAQEGIAR